MNYLRICLTPTVHQSLENLLCIFIIILLSVNTLCNGSSSKDIGGSKGPWYTGPLLTPTAYVLTPGQGNIESYLFYTITNGAYNKHWKGKSLPNRYQWNPQLTFKLGILEGVDFSGVLQSYINQTQRVAASSFGDLPLGFGFQAFKIGPEEEIALCKIFIQETFPTGRYQNLNQKKLGTDGGGQGTYATQIAVCFSKQFKLPSDRYFRGRWAFLTTYSAPVSVRGLNVYGGGSGTKGTEYPGVSCVFLTSGEYTITRNWVVACDLQIAYSARNRFSGRTMNPMTSRTSVQFSLAPAMEYNWDEKLGVIIGPWFTFAGKNCRRFISLVAALNYNF